MDEMHELAAQQVGEIAAIIIVLRQLLNRFPKEEQDDIRAFVEGRFTDDKSNDELAAVNDAVRSTIRKIFTSVTPE